MDNINETTSNGIDSNGTNTVVQVNTSKLLDLLSVDDVLKLGQNYSFFVPAYQRGYRWRPKEVELFIEDLVQFRTEEDQKSASDRCPFCCLQAIVVKDRGNNELEVIDGQQRLTTVLILLQALYTIKEKSSLQIKIELESAGNPIKVSNPIICSGVYSIEYEHRPDSNMWLEEITRAYFLDIINGNTQELDRLKNRNSDYYHLVDAYTTSIKIFNGWTTDNDRSTFDETLKKFTRFIWYDITKNNSNDTEVDIFDRINATKIALNNAELIKALLLQKDNFGSDTQLRDQLAIDWDSIEKRLQEPSFWGFVYSTRHPYEYETHIEYIFDLLKNKTESDRDDYYFTFNQYYAAFLRNQKDRLTFVKNSWEEVLKTMLLLEEWYNDRTCYHYIGYLLEYGKELNTTNDISIPYLRGLLTGINKDQRTAKLKELVKHSLEGLQSKELFHGPRGNKVTQLLFLLNIQSEQNRNSDTARFSFSSYKQIWKSPGWNEEHVASNVDYSLDPNDREGLAYALFEYFTGVVKGAEDLTQYEINVRAQYPADQDAKDLCDKLWGFLTIKKTDKDFEKDLNAIYDEIMGYFEDKNDKFKEPVLVGRAKRREKDFIWNFALLNATTNKSYGNSIYPLKRKRIMSDEYYIYTPICTRALFEKAYSHKLSNLMVWSRKDAKDYWDYICSCLSEFLPVNFNLPFTY